jgi:hypothetical protein
MILRKITPLRQSSDHLTCPVCDSARQHAVQPQGPGKVYTPESMVSQTGPTTNTWRFNGDSGQGTVNG